MEMNMRTHNVNTFDEKKSFSYGTCDLGGSREHPRSLRRVLGGPEWPKQMEKGQFSKFLNHIQNGIISKKSS
jgi:hypothetical protein